MSEIKDDNSIGSKIFFVIKILVTIAFFGYIVFSFFGFGNKKTNNYYSDGYRSSSYSHSNDYDGNCTFDCSGHNAGYEWAQDNDIDDPDDCGGNSNSFIEGCETYANEVQDHYQSARDDYYDSLQERNNSYR